MKEPSFANSKSSPEVIKNFASHLNKVLPISTNTEGRSYKALNSDHIFDYSHGTSFLTKKNVEYAISTTGYRTDYEIDEKELIASGEAVNQSVAATLLIDVNCEKSPNVLGRDSFMYFSFITLTNTSMKGTKPLGLALFSHLNFITPHAGRC